MSDTPPREGDLAAAAPRRLERACAFAIALATCVTFIVIAPSARVAMPRVGAFVPAYESALALTDLIAAVLLLAHFHRGKSYAVLILACGYFFNAAIIVPHLLTFPGVFSEGGLLGAGTQSTAWLYCFWHGGFALFVLAFAVLRRTKPDARARTRPLRLVVVAVLATVAVVAALTALATAGAAHLTTIVENGDYARLVTTGISPAICAITALAALLLLPRRRVGVLDLWMLVVLTAWLCDVLLSAVVGANRFDLGWYAGRSFGLIAAVILLILLLAEFSRLDQTLVSRTAQLRASETLIKMFFEYSSECFAVLAQAETGAFRYEEINAATLALYGRTRAEVIGRTTNEVMDAETADQLNAHLTAALRSPTPYRYERQQGGKVIEALATPLPLDPDRPRQIQVSARDITERRNLEDQLRQAQKMEAVGQLTGGIAHDFNNMLAIITGSLDLARRRLAAGSLEGVMKWLDNAAEGAARAATLTSRLLSFSRRQALEPRMLDLNTSVSAISQLLRHTIPESVEIESVLAAGLWKVMVDPSQLENCLVNLAVNARDAMPGGGRLTVETRNAYLDERYVQAHSDLRPGQYVLVSVTDTGGGMAPEVANRAFEPFFSTKPAGHGTGLGLSQVFGFVKQSNGHVKIYSEVGHGTSVNLYLPRHVGAETLAEAPAPAPSPRPTRGELVLVVEDDAAVRAVSAEALRTLGFVAVSAESPAQALQLLAQHDEIVLLFTDVVMPGMTGRELAVQAQRMRAELKVLFTTGYSRNAIVHNGVLDPDTVLLQKPFTIEELSVKLSQVFGQ
jgi:PAS domain S-box-containing protein